MTDHQFYFAFGEAIQAQDREGYMSELALSSAFLPPEDDTAKVDTALVEQLGTIWDVSHMTVKDIRQRAGLSQAEFAVKFCVPFRTVQNWEARESCPPYTKLMMAELLGYIQR